MLSLFAISVNRKHIRYIIPYPTAFPYGNGMVLHFYQQQERLLEILTSVRRLYISFKSLVNDFVYSFGRAALLLLVEV